MKKSSFLEKVVDYFTSETLRPSARDVRGRRTNERSGASKARSLRLEALENRELLTATPNDPSAVEAFATDVAVFSTFETATPALDLSALDAAASVEPTVFSADAPATASADAATSKTWTVTSALDDGSEGTLRATIKNAKAGDTITFDASLKGSTITLTEGQLEIAKSLTIDASALSDAKTQTTGITIDANKKSRVFEISGGDEGVLATLNGLTITNGLAKSNGGGICVDSNATLSLTNSVVSKNKVSTADNGKTRVFGGGIYVASGATLSLTNALVSKNVAVGTYSYGGGIYSNGEVSATQTTIAGNQAEYGGGFCADGSTAVLTNTIVARNSGKQAVDEIYVRGDSNDEIYVRSGSKVYAKNVLTSYGGLGESENENCVVYDPNKPLFVDATKGDYRLAEDSQAIDKGDNESSKELTTDLDGRLRLVADVVDLGAYEYQFDLESVSLSTNNPEYGSEISATLAPNKPESVVQCRTTAAYQWYRVDAKGVETAIEGATAATYTPTPVDVGYKLKVVATGTRYTLGTQTATTTEYTIGKIDGVAVSQNLTELFAGKTALTASVAPQEATVAYQWYRVDAEGVATAIEGATNAKYTAARADAGCCLKVEATGTGYWNGTKTVQTTDFVQIQLTRVGTSTSKPKVGETITTTLYSFGRSEADAAATATYQWYRVDAKGNVTEIAGATAASYTPINDDLGCNIRVVATGTGNYVGTKTATHSKKTISVLSGIATSTDNPQVGEEISTTVSAAGEVDAGATATYQWSRVDSKGKATAIKGATAATYTPTPVDAGYKLKVVATGTGNYEGKTAATTKEFTVGTIDGVAISQSSTETLAGKTVLTATVVPQEATVAYQWYRVDAKTGAETAIEGATNAEYTAARDDAGCCLKVETTGTGYWNGTETAQTTDFVRIALTKIGTSTSQPQVGVEITTRLYVAGEIDSAATATYQWYRVDSKTGAATKIADATGSSYTPTAEDVGYKLRVTAEGSGIYGGTVTATHSKPTIAAKSSAVLDADAFDGAFASFDDWGDAF